MKEDLADINRVCACLHTRMTARAITRAYDEALRPSGLKITQFTLLAMIADGAPTSITDLADSMAIERTTLVRNLQLLRKEGLVTPEAGPNRRLKPLLTEKGWAVFQEALPLWKSVQDTLEGNLGFGAWQVTRRRLKDLREAVG